MLILFCCRYTTAFLKSVCEQVFKKIEHNDFIVLTLLETREHLSTYKLHLP